MRYAPYSAKHFLGRPKINAPANTTQFLFDDKEPDFHCQLLKNESELSDQAKNSSQSNMSSEDETAQPSIPLNCSSDNVNDDNHNGYLMCDSIEDDKFHTEEFDRLYDNIRMEMLRTEPVDELTSRCMELETAIHNLRYLLQKESTTRSKLNEIVHLRERNAELTKENENLRKACNAGFQINAPHKLETGDDSWEPEVFLCWYKYSYDFQNYLETTASSMIYTVDYSCSENCFFIIYINGWLIFLFLLNVLNTIIYVHYKQAWVEYLPACWWYPLQTFYSKPGTWKSFVIWCLAYGLYCNVDKTLKASFLNGIESTYDKQV